MTSRLLRVTASAAALSLSFTAGAASADEGMWTFDNFPIQQVNQRYGTSIDQAWLDRVRGAAVRLNGCSASFVSDEGLILTNHHCVVDCVQDLSSADADYVANGWMTATREEEKTCPGQTAEVLTDITDVTERVQAAGAGLEGQAFTAARAGVVSGIEREACGDDPKLTCQVISLYRGGQYALYKFRKYDDVRLVFAPEFQAAFFGGDPDNFNFPRYALDAAFLRAYEDGQPVSTPDHLTWNASAPAEGDATFVVGNPGTTNRLMTVSQMESLRDQQIPIAQLMRAELRGRLLQFSTQGEEEARISVDPIFGLENGFKVFVGQEAALTDPAFMGGIREREQALRAAVAADPALAQRIGDPWADLERVQEASRELWLPNRQLEANAGGGSQLYTYARAIVRALNDPAGLSDARRAALTRQLSSEAPVYPQLEEIFLATWLSKTREWLTVDSPAVKTLLGTESPEVIADRLAQSSLVDPAARLALLNGGAEALRASNDPMIQFVLRTEGLGREAKGQWDTRVAAPTAQAAERVAQARFAVYGDSQYPDATFSLRISYGAVQGWTYRGVTVPPFTRMGGLYERATGSAPFNLAPRFEAAESRLNKDVVYDYVTTNDITGGNSGSPVVNARGEVIGAAFDGNIHSLGGAFAFDESLNRTVVVSTAAVTEALRTVYDQPRLLEELGVR